MAHARVYAAGADALDDLIDLIEATAQWLWDKGIPQWEPGSFRSDRARLKAEVESGWILAIPRSGGGFSAGCILTRLPPPIW